MDALSVKKKCDENSVQARAVDVIRVKHWNIIMKTNNFLETRVYKIRLEKFLKKNVNFSFWNFQDSGFKQQQQQNNNNNNNNNDDDDDKPCFLNFRPNEII